MLGVHFFEPLNLFENTLDGQNWPCALAAISEDQKWKTFLMLIFSSHGYRGSKKYTPKIIPFC